MDTTGVNGLTEPSLTGGLLPVLTYSVLLEALAMLGHGRYVASEQYLAMLVVWYTCEILGCES